MPNPTDAILLKNRAVLTLSGPDRKDFIQGLITNDVEKISENSGIYAGLLTPQGKYLHDFFILEHDETLYLDCERDRLPDLFRRLMMYKLRADVHSADCPDEYIILAIPSRPVTAEIFTADPRHAQMGYRALIPAGQDISRYQNETPYDDLRLTLGLPDGSRDFDVDRTLILEGNMAELNGVDFDKGCYVGQEVTARMKHRAVLKKRLLPVQVAGPLPDRGTDIINEAGQKIGDIRSGHNNMAMGYFRLAHMEFNKGYACGDALVTPRRPELVKA